MRLSRPSALVRSRNVDKAMRMDGRSAGESGNNSYDDSADLAYAGFITISGRRANENASDSGPPTPYGSKIMTDAIQARPHRAAVS